MPIYQKPKDENMGWTGQLCTKSKIQNNLTTILITLVENLTKVVCHKITKVRLHTFHAFRVTCCVLKSHADSIIVIFTEKVWLATLDKD